MSTRTIDFGRLEKVDLREGWASEASGFTPWLAREDNLKLLSDAIGVDLECEGQEKRVGPFRADILCKDTETEAWVLIENQLERTDHSHLGQLLTYAAGLNAVTIVWIAEKFTDEHRAALDWLNQRTDEHINLFGLEIELWRIGHSPIAPKFNVVCKPNGWTRSVHSGLAAIDELSEAQQRQLRYWTAFREHMEKAGSTVRCQKPLPQHWMAHAIGRSGIHLTSLVSSRGKLPDEKNPGIRSELTVNGPQARREFDVLLAQKAEVEAQLGFPLRWQALDGRIACRIYVRKDVDITNEALWPEQFEWLRIHLEALHRVFAPRIRQLKNDEEE